MAELATNTRPLVSIVIPVYNEEAILRAAVVDLIDRLNALPWSYELVIAENGSTDRTVETSAELAERFDSARVSTHRRAKLWEGATRWNPACTR